MQLIYSLSGKLLLKEADRGANLNKEHERNSVSPGTSYNINSIYCEEARLDYLNTSISSVRTEPSKASLSWRKMTTLSIDVCLTQSSSA